jgi:hypothetical protein
LGAHSRLAACAFFKVPAGIVEDVVIGRRVCLAVFVCQEKLAYLVVVQMWIQVLSFLKRLRGQKAFGFGSHLLP